MRDIEKTAKTLAILKLVVAVLVVLCLALLIALIVVVATQQPKEIKQDGAENSGGGAAVKSCSDNMKLKVKSTRSAGVFDDLSEDELIRVRDYMLGQASLNLTDFKEARINNNWIYMIELQPPSKDEALAYLDRSGPKPDRKARVVVYLGGAAAPVVQEYTVSPAGNPKSHETSNGPGKAPIPFHARPTLDSVEGNELTRILLNVTKHTYRLLKESFDGFTYYNCTDRCLTWANGAPTVLRSGERKLWVWFMRDLPGLTLNSVGFEVRVNTEGTDVSSWGVEMVYFNGKMYESVDELMEAYENGSIGGLLMEAPKPGEPLYGSFERRGDPQPETPMRGPRQFEPDGKRYAVEGRHVEYMGWSFDFRVRTSSGLQLYDIRFNNERIVYEVSLQEALAFYSGWNPTRMHMNYLDDAWKMGSSAFELVRGVDCPETATFFDLWHYLDTGKPRKYSNAVCVFEMNNGLPLRRHFNDDFVGGYSYYGGMVSNALILRTVTTPYNYDYVNDYVFHPNGVIEVRIGTTGYVQGPYWSPEQSPYANQIHKHVGGPIHDHMMNYKVDLDVGGRDNIYQTLNVERENITNHWFPDVYHIQKKIVPVKLTSEQEALYKFNFEHPKYLLFSNPAKKNKWNVTRSYRIQINNVMKQLYPDDWPVLKMAAWSKYQMAVSKYKKDEDRSSSIYNQNDPFNPAVDFDSFVRDNENIENQDLVAWVTMGVIHIPHAEDVPVTATAANMAQFFIRPYNYFDEDPSMNSRDLVVITPKDKHYSAVKVERFGTPSGPVCSPRELEIKYNGTYG